MHPTAAEGPRANPKGALGPYRGEDPLGTLAGDSLINGRKGGPMKKWLVMAVFVAGAFGLMRLAAARRVGSEPRKTIWEKLEARMEEMPEDFPPRVMFDNVAAAKENTERILEILGKGGSAAAQEPADAEAG